MKITFGLTLLLVFSFPLFLNSQISTVYDECATLYDELPTGPYSHSIDPAFYEDSDPIVLNVFYWQVLAPDGSYGWGNFS